MKECKKRRSAIAGTNELPGRKSLPLLRFEEYTTSIIGELIASLPLAFTREDLLLRALN
jgi:hypothetical protein